MLKLRRTSAALAACGMVLFAGPALATPPPLAAPPPATDASPQPGDATTVRKSPSCVFSCLKRSSQLLGTMFGLRPALSRHGITLTASETSELLGNVSGGNRRGFVYDGLTQADLQLDTQRAFGHYGGTLNLSGLQIHGKNLSALNLGSLQTASGIEADRSTRIWEAWYQQQLRSDNRLDVKIGQQSLDQEFMVNQNSLLFVNTMFGWPMLPSADMPGGGPAYPLSALGVRLRARPNNAFTVLGGVFNGSPTRTNQGGDPQTLDSAGTSFPLNGGTLAIGEVQYTYPALGSIVYGDRREPLARTIKVGAWYDSERFSDLAVAQTHQGNYAFYATADQLLHQDQDNPYKTLNLFARVMSTPLGSENLIAFSADGGLTLHAPIRHRRDDTLGFGGGYARVGSGAMNSDAATAQFGGTFYPVRGSETFLESTYQLQLHPWLQVQPDIQYVMNPGAGVVNPSSPNKRIGNEIVIGVRTIIQL